MSGRGRAVRGAPGAAAAPPPTVSPPSARALRAARRAILRDAPATQPQPRARRGASTLPASPPPPPPPRRAAAPSPPAPSLPVDVWAAVCALLPPTDAFAVARVCRAGRAASKSPAAWPVVDLAALDRLLAAKRGPDVVDLTTGKALEASRPRSVPGFASFLGDHCAAGITVLVVSAQDLELARPLLRRCTSLRRLVVAPPRVGALPVWQPVLLAAVRAVRESGARLVHARLPAWSAEIVEELRLIPSLASLSVSTLRGGTGVAAADLRALEGLLSTGVLRCLELVIMLQAYELQPLAVSSPTLVLLEVTGKNVRLLKMECPALEELRVHSYGRLPITHPFAEAGWAGRSGLRARCPKLRLIEGVFVAGFDGHVGHCSCGAALRAWRTEAAWRAGGLCDACRARYGWPEILDDDGAAGD